MEVGEEDPKQDTGRCKGPVVESSWVFRKYSAAVSLYI